MNFFYHDSLTDVPCTFHRASLDVDSEQGHQALSFAKSIDEGLSKTMRRSDVLNRLNSLNTTNFIQVIFNHLDVGHSISPSSWSMKASQRHRSFFVHLLPEDFSGPPSSILETDIECLRQAEAAFFMLCEPWASRSERGNLGIANILKLCLPSHEPLSQYWFRKLLGELYEGLKTVVRDSLRYLKCMVLALLIIYALCLVVAIYYLEESTQ